MPVVNTTCRDPISLSLRFRTFLVLGKSWSRSASIEKLKMQDRKTARNINLPALRLGRLT